jgi:hypothetical protein
MSNHELIETLDHQERTMERVNRISGKQETYFQSLENYLGSFLAYFTKTEENLAVLEKSIEGVRLLDQELFARYEEM